MFNTSSVIATAITPSENDSRRLVLTTNGSRKRSIRLRPAPRASGSRFPSARTRHAAGGLVVAAGDDRPETSFPLIEQRPRAVAQRGSQPRIRKAVFQERGAVALRRTDVVTALSFGQGHGHDPAASSEHPPQPVGELHL